MARRAGVLTVVSAAAVLAAAGPAAADVTVSPASAPQGSGANLTFRVTNDGAEPITEVTLKIPADSPIAEVYPLSVNDWAPKISWQRLSQPLAQIHGATPVDEVPSAITWIAVNGTAIAPGESADLSVALGPLPTLSSVAFTLDGRYADGSAAPAMPPASLSLTPSDGTATTSHHGGTGTTGTDETGALSPEEQAAYNDILAESDGPTVVSLAGWGVAALALLGAGWAMLRNRHRASEDEPEPDDGEPDAAAAGADREPVAAGSGSKWAFKG
ncbi:hypothetical protein ACTI_77080 [Actinoplanes sp. OR16]|uniref:DUF1775 domain-containing protein n=1 Tax=Actinoplanes sp. OR16 TaxID=946334 RepID=UPI000F70F25D|nr:DUF1775 domain-containing protein [Actinoplanes sp. OR16]BBH71023.1 hypothetical protein ACTI_77080 [Actinoplanes sp. OR16]